ncbi:pentatricopeptide repeat-containing protein At5g04780, mitochondrial isoform X3 [Vigna umbellata]|uniref:pentatricopeptide repeat-containing protein At5g04780, mitochondrial isoform X3 n=1 Tax=Vigna umbellata TaxID=87088 RepID=UPI001F5F6939|nr:pentatricopeptide repeat-containing protein At5g04780, mitochondrial isoform X3 [Vigna umbellata]
MKTLRRCERFCDCYGIQFRKLSVISEGKPKPSMVENVVHMERVSNLHYLLQLCAKTRSSMGGRACHAQVIRVGWEIDVLTSNMLINMYSKCSLVDSARKKFNEMTVKSLVSWNTMIGALTQNAEDQEEALTLLIQMQREGTPFNEFTISSVLCLATLVEGKQLHAISNKYGSGSNIYVSSSLIDMYAKCGCIKEAYLVFQGVMEVWSIVLWNAMISGFARHSHAPEAMVLFEKMQQKGFFPDDVTYVAVLNACSHMGLHEEGQKYFDLMVRQHKLSPSVLHYSCMVDILGRAGLVHKAYELIERMPFNATSSMWGSLLASCRVYGNIELAEIAAKHLFEMEPNNAGNHILLANIYAANKKWDEVARARKLLRESDLKKERGTSWIEIKNKIHSFTVGERNHPLIDEIYAKLDDLVVELKKLNYEVDTDNDLHDVEESRKQMLLRHHSEKLAITFGLMCLPSGIPIRIIKNLRICGDCHIFMKLMSKFTSREIIVRDTNRFHHFRDGFCSCREFW